MYVSDLTEAIIFLVVAFVEYDNICGNVNIDTVVRVGWFLTRSCKIKARRRCGIVAGQPCIVSVGPTRKHLPFFLLRGHLLIGVIILPILGALVYKVCCVC